MNRHLKITLVCLAFFAVFALIVFGIIPIIAAMKRSGTDLPAAHRAMWWIAAAAGALVAAARDDTRSGARRAIALSLGLACLFGLVRIAAANASVPAWQRLIVEAIITFAGGYCLCMLWRAITNGQLGNRATVKYLREVQPLIRAALYITLIAGVLRLVYVFAWTPSMTPNEIVQNGAAWAWMFFLHLLTITLGLMLGKLARFIGKAFTPRLPALTFCFGAMFPLLRWRIELWGSSQTRTAFALELGLAMLLGAFVDLLNNRRRPEREISGLIGGLGNDLEEHVDEPIIAIGISLALLLVLSLSIIDVACAPSVAASMDGNVALGHALIYIDIVAGILALIFGVVLGLLLTTSVQDLPKLQHESDIAERWLEYRRAKMYARHWWLALLGLLLVAIGCHGQVQEILLLVPSGYVIFVLSGMLRKAKAALPGADDVREKVFAYDLQKTI